jgi:hypothetical protein
VPTLGVQFGVVFSSCSRSFPRPVLEDLRLLRALLVCVPQAFGGAVQELDSSVPPSWHLVCRVLSLPRCRRPLGLLSLAQLLPLLVKSASDGWFMQLL